MNSSTRCGAPITNVEAWIADYVTLCYACATANGVDAGRRNRAWGRLRGKRAFRLEGSPPPRVATEVEV